MNSKPQGVEMNEIDFVDTVPTGPAPLDGPHARVPRVHRPDPRDKWLSRFVWAMLIAAACAAIFFPRSAASDKPAPLPKCSMDLAQPTV